MNHLVSSFKEHLGLRGVHVYTESECKFLNWQEVLAFMGRLPDRSDPAFSDKLVETMANYNPDKEFLAIQQVEDTVSIELYAKQ
jgi:hypothetical protein